MFNKPTTPKSAIPFSQRLITLGIIAFFLYFYFTEFQTEQLKKKQLEQAMTNKIKIVNLLTKEEVLIDPAIAGKTIIALDKNALQKATKDKVEVIEIIIPEPIAPAKPPAAEQKQNLTK